MNYFVKAREGVRDTEDEHPLLCPQWSSVLHWEGPSLPYWWLELRPDALLKQPRKWWRQMDNDLIKSGPDCMMIEGVNWRWMHDMAANPTPPLKLCSEECNRHVSQQMDKAEYVQCFHSQTSKCTILSLRIVLCWHPRYCFSIIFPPQEEFYASLALQFIQATLFK